jgi:hypothetical protein
VAVKGLRDRKATSKYKTCVELEVALMGHFDSIRNDIVHGVSWGLQLHECDLLIVSKTGYLTEVEIKISKADLLKDKEKKHGHENDRIRNLWFAISDNIPFDFALANIPERSGLIVVYGNGDCVIKRKPKSNTGARKITNEERSKLHWLGMIRILGLKKRIVKIESENRALKIESKRCSCGVK